MGSALSSDSGRAASATRAIPSALPRKSEVELPITSFDCSVCLEVLHQPIRTRCGHVFCRSCISTSLRNSKWTCPYCRAYLPSEGVPATDIMKKMKAVYQNCTECNTQVCLSEMRAHIRTCQKYIEKYGPLQELGEVTRCMCPFCEKELDEDSLLNHCLTYHRSERRPVTMLQCLSKAFTWPRSFFLLRQLMRTWVLFFTDWFCPLCHFIPNGDSNNSSDSLIRHLQIRHTMFYDEFLDFNILEEALIRRVLDRSLLEYMSHSNST